MEFYNDFVTLIEYLFENYAILKFSNGYEPQFTLTEFIEFLHYFAKRFENPGIKEMLSEMLKNKDKIDLGEIISGFFQAENPYSDFSYLTLIYDSNLEKYTFKINYELYMGHLKERHSILCFNELEYFYHYYESKKPNYIYADEIILSFLNGKPKRKIDKTISTSEEELIIAKSVSAFMVNEIWKNHIRIPLDLNKYPIQRSDIHVTSMEKELLKLYKELYERLSVMYHQDKELHIAASEYVCLARKNFELLIDGYENFLNEIFNHVGFEIDLSTKTIKDCYSASSVYYEDDDIEYRETSYELDPDNGKLLKKLDKYSKALK